jgi:hypothetical protein
MIETLHPYLIWGAMIALVLLAILWAPVLSLHSYFDRLALIALGLSVAVSFYLDLDGNVDLATFVVNACICVAAWTVLIGVLLHGAVLIPWIRNGRLVRRTRRRPRHSR